MGIPIMGKCSCEEVGLRDMLQCTIINSLGIVLRVVS